jgi:enterochelin esterase-like enzyme
VDGSAVRSIWTRRTENRRSSRGSCTISSRGWTPRSARFPNGGLAAFNLALRHPDVFGAAAAHSASFHLKHPFGVHKLLGNDSTAAVLLEEHSPLIYIADEAAAARQLTLYFDCGVKDPDLPDNRALSARLDSLAVPHTYHEFPGGHGWGYWRAHLVTSLETVTAGMRDADSGP